AMVSAIRKRFPDVWQDVHLMMDNPQDYLDVFMDAGADAVTIHAEIEADMGNILRKIRARGVKAGVSIKPKTPVEAIEPILENCDLILVMTVEPGFGGQKFMADMMPKISYLRRVGYTGNILVDGGVNAETAVQCVESGADTLIMGTALLKAQEPAAVMAACRALEK
ncbi:MAG: ribulose-phosphate 3-epimerase, partial [Clostridia bacterium]|nr:ribulose-phosphate 3-epimerase [Clostridia bacterium]